jgi:hypothetical protein
MFSNFRLATPAEIDTIKDHSDLGPNCTVLAWDNGDKADLVVIRQALEADPIFWAEGTSSSRKLVFLAILENVLKFAFNNPSAFYFNVHADNADWRATLEKLGAQPTSTAPEFRYKKPIL